MISNTTAQMERVTLMAEWTRLGVLFNTAPAPYRVDLENLTVRTAMLARMDERLFVTAASWLAEHHQLVDARRLGRKLEELPEESSAVAGALLTVALQEARSATQLQAAVKHCKAMKEKQPLYFVLLVYPQLLELVKQESLSLFEEWGFWHNDATLKRNAIRPIDWVFRECPEMRLRALVGAGLDSEILDLVHDMPRTVTDIAKATSATYAAVHAGATRLMKRGLLQRDQASKRQFRLGPTFSRIVAQDNGSTGPVVRAA